MYELSTVGARLENRASRLRTGRLVAVAIMLLLFVIPTSSAAPRARRAVDLDMLCAHLPPPDGGEDETVQAQNSDLMDVHLGNDVVSSAAQVVYFGFSKKFDTLVVDVGLPGVGGVLSWSYSDSIYWTPLVVADETAGFTNPGVHEITFLPPPDWEKKVLSLADCPGDLFYVRVVTHNPFAVAPLGNQVSAIR